MKKIIRLAFLFAGVAAGSWVAARLLHARRGRQSAEAGLPLLERRADPDPESLAAKSDGRFDRIGLDVDRLKDLESSSYKPLVQYLTAIQVKRGEVGETLLFVRQKDLDALAKLSGDSPQGFVKQFRELGILMSMN